MRFARLENFSELGLQISIFSFGKSIFQRGHSCFQRGKSPKLLARFARMQYIEYLHCSLLKLHIVCTLNLLPRVYLPWNKLPPPLIPTRSRNLNDFFSPRQSVAGAIFFYDPIAIAEKTIFLQRTHTYSVTKIYFSADRNRNSDDTRRNLSELGTGVGGTHSTRAVYTVHGLHGFHTP